MQKTLAFPSLRNNEKLESKFDYYLGYDAIVAL